MNPSQIDHRPALPSDVPFVVDSWADSYRTSYAAGPTPMPLYQRHMRETLAWLFQHRAPEVLIAFSPEGGDKDIYGWLCLERGITAPQSVREAGRYVTRVMPIGVVVHYVYTKECYRKLNIARYLFRIAGIDLQSAWLFSAKTAASERITKRLAPHARFNPLLPRFPKTQTQDGNEALADHL